MLMLRISLCVLAMSSMASAFIPSSVGPMSSLRLGGNRATVSRLTSLPKLAKGLRMTIAMPPLGELENLEGKIPDCPNTIWNAGNIDLAAEQVIFQRNQTRTRVKKDSGSIFDLLLCSPLGEVPC
jgi:hypothetical protein